MLQNGTQILCAPQASLDSFFKEERILDTIETHINLRRWFQHDSKKHAKD